MKERKIKGSTVAVFVWILLVKSVSSTRLQGLQALAGLTYHRTLLRLLVAFAIIVPTIRLVKFQPPYVLNRLEPAVCRSAKFRHPSTQTKTSDLLELMTVVKTHLTSACRAVWGTSCCRNARRLFEIAHVRFCVTKRVRQLVVGGVRIQVPRREPKRGGSLKTND